MRILVRMSDDEGRLHQHERHIRILDEVRTHPRVEVAALAEQLEVTAETIRRDLSALERRGLVRRIHGGAVHVERLGYEPSVSVRREQRTTEKERIGRAAADLLPDGGSIVVDAGTTTLELVRHLPSDISLTVVTNSLPAAAILADFSRVEVVVLGGRMRGITHATVGESATTVLRELVIDVAFMGTNGITPEYGLTTPDADEARVKAAMIAAAKQVVCLTDHSKMGLSQLCRFASLDQVDVIITDAGLDNALTDELTLAGPEVIRA